MGQGGLLADYDPGALFCEMLRPGQASHPALSLLLERLRDMPIEALRRRAADAERDLLERGITFTVYSDATAIDRILPFDLIPRVITADEWRTLEAGVIQRVRALNMFLHDVYHGQRILADGIVPRALVLGNAGYSQAMVGFEPRSAPMCMSAAPTSSATTPGASWCWRTTPARPPASPMWSRTGT